MVAILGYSREQIFEAVKQMYTAVAEAPDSPFHFPVGEPACRKLGYPPEQLAALPEALRTSFAGVGWPFRAGAVRPGDTVLDVGAGAGTDAVIAAGLTGPGGRVLALDLTPAMTDKLERTARQAGLDNIEVLQGSAERLPLADKSADVITSNGALNLVPDKRRAVAEMFRVLRPGGRLQLADVVIHRPVTVDCREDPRLWVECVVGATVKEDLLAMLREAGFEDVQVLHRHDYFALSPSQQTREIAAGFGAHSVEISARRGPRAPGRLRRWLHRLDPRRPARLLARRGLLGVAGLALALLSCYGTLAATALLAALGAGLALDETLWTGAIAVFALLAAAAVATGPRRHGRYDPVVLAAAGAGTILFALFVRYHPLTELAGFLLLAAAVIRDVVLRKRKEADTLGLKSR